MKTIQHMSQLSEQLEGVVLRKFGKWTIEQTRKGLCVTDGNIWQWVTIYQHSGQWCVSEATSYHNAIPRKDIMEWLDNYAKQ